MGPAPDGHLTRETLKGVAAGLLGAVLPSLPGLSGADAAIVHAMRDVAVELAPAIFFNAVMSALVPAAVMLRRRRRSCASVGAGPLRSLAVPAAVVLGLAAGGTVAAVGLVLAAGLALPGLAASGVMLVRAVQAMLVAAVLTPLTIIALSRRSTGG